MQSKFRRKGKYRANHFMDVAIEAYIREISLNKLREVMEIMEASGFKMEEAVAQALDFIERGEYIENWKSIWQEELIEQPPGDEGALFTRIESAVRRSITEEREARKNQGKLTIEDTAHYKDFIDRSMDQLLGEASGEIEDMD